MNTRYLYCLATFFFQVILNVPAMAAGPSLETSKILLPRDPGDFITNGSYSSPLIVDVVELGCGWSDIVYDRLSHQLPEKAVLNLALRPKGMETGRRLYLFSDKSWFLTLEYLSPDSVDKDITCIVMKGPGEDVEKAFEYELTPIVFL